MTENEISCQLTSHLPGEGKSSQPLVASLFNLKEHIFLAWKCKIWIQCAGCLCSHVKQYNGTWKKRSNLLSVEEVSSRATYYFKMCFQQQSLHEPLSHRNLFCPLGVGEFLPAWVEVADVTGLQKVLLFTAPFSPKVPQNATKLMGMSLWQPPMLLSFPFAEPDMLLTAIKLLQSSGCIPHHPRIQPFTSFSFHFLQLELSVSFH